MEKILYLLMTTESYSDRRVAILNSWGKNQNIYFYSEHEDKDQKCVQVHTSNSAPTKQLFVFKYIRDNFHNKYEWFFFGDDDTFVNTKLMNESLDSLDINSVHGKDIFGCWKDDLHYPSGGAGFLVHNSIIDKFFDFEVVHVHYGDVLFGMMMREKGVNFVHNPLFNWQSPEKENLSDEVIKQYLTFHYVSTSEQHQKLQSLCALKNGQLDMGKLLPRNIKSLKVYAVRLCNRWFRNIWFNLR